MADPFDSIVHQCRHSASQEDRLRYCRFCRESQEGLGSLSGEESSVPDDIPVAHTGIVICSPPESSIDEDTPQEEFQTAEEVQRRDLDEHCDSKIDGVDNDGDAIDAVADVSPDLARIVDLGKDTDLVFSEEKSAAEKGFSTPRTDDIEGADGAGHIVGEAPEVEVSACEWKKNEALKRKSPELEDLGFPESKGKGLGKSPSKISRNFERNLILNDVDNAFDDSVNPAGEVRVGGDSEKPSESSAEKKLGLLNSKGDKPCNSASKFLENSQKIATPAPETNEMVNNANSFHEFSGENPLNDSKGNTPVVHPVVLMTEVLESEPGDNGGVLVSRKQTIKEDSPLKAIEKDLGLNTSTEMVLKLGNPHTHEEHNDEEVNSTSNNLEKLEKFEYIDSGDLSPEVTSEEPPGLRRLPNWVDGVEENAIGGSGRGGRRRGEDATGSGQGERRRVGEAEGSGQGGRRAREASTSKNPPQPTSNLLGTMNRASREMDQSKRDVDILDVAKQAGMNFPRPRWWRPEGY